MRLSVIIPAYNEEKRIRNTIDEYVNFFRIKIKEKRLFKFELVVVLNGCKDRTLEIVKQLQKKYSEIILLNFKESGKGFAITEGFKNALKRDNDLIGFVDADMATSPKAFYDLTRDINYHDGIIASRWLKGSVIKTRQPLLRRIMSRGFNFLARTILFLPYKDTQCGAKVFKRRVIEQVVKNVGRAQWAFDIELLYKMKSRGFKIIERKTVWQDRKESKLNVTKVPLQMFLSIIRIRLLNSPFKKIVKIYDNLPKKIKIHNIN